MAAAQRSGSSFYVWTFPGSPVKIHLDFAAVTALQAHPRTPGEGILLGGGEPGSVKVIRLEAAGPQRPLSALLREFPEEQIVGYFRIGGDERLRLNSKDIETAELYFHQPRHVFLRIQPLDTGPANATFFFWDRGRLIGDIVLLEFPLDATLLSAAERWPAPSLEPAETAAPAEPGGATVAGLPDRNAVVHPLPDAKWKLPIACLLLLGLGSCASYFAAALLGVGPARKPAVALHAERVGGDVYVRWDRAKAVMQSATSGVLSLSQRGATRTIPLDPAFLRSGSVIVSSVKDDLRIDLQVFSKSGTFTETLLATSPRPPTGLAPPDPSPPRARRIKQPSDASDVAVGAPDTSRLVADPSHPSQFQHGGAQADIAQAITYTQPLLALVLAMLIGGMIRLRLRRKTGLLWAGIASAALISWPPVEWLLSRPLESPYSNARIDPPPGVGAIVVLGSSVEAASVLRPYALPDLSMYHRCEAAAWIYRKHPTLPVVVSGGAYGDGPPVADVMRDLLRRAGVPEGMIWLERRSRSTYENAVNSTELLRRFGIRDIVLIVDARSMTRAAACFRKQGFVVLPAPSERRDWGGRNENFLPDARTVLKNEITLHEALGIAWYALTGRI
jgi:uncharacterized SAM-binding protein YcdF (DUF218 family)